MIKYRVSIWFGIYEVNPFIIPNKVITVHSDVELNHSEAVIEALKIIDTYPRTYAAQVIKL